MVSRNKVNGKMGSLLGKKRQRKVDFKQDDEKSPYIEIKEVLRQQEDLEKSPSLPDSEWSDEK